MNNLEELGYFLYMESKEIEKKIDNNENLTKYEEINMNLNPFISIKKATKTEKIKLKNK